MSNFSFGMGIESVIRHEQNHPILASQSKKYGATALNVNFTVYDPIKSIFNLDQTIENQLLNSIKPRQFIEESLINYRAYHQVLSKLKDKVTQRHNFKSTKHETIWGLGVDTLTLLEDLQSEVSAHIAMDIQV